MAVYKVPQDVEADDKLIGPFSFRQFIYLIVVAISLALAWFMSQIFIGLVIIPLPFIIFFGALALPLRKDQPMEIYLAAVVRFLLKPRLRFWQPEGQVNLVTIVAPHVAERSLTKDYNADEAQRRLSYLSQVIDTQGWASRGVGVTNTALANLNDTVTAEASTIDDIMDSQVGIGRQFDSLIEQQDLIRKQQVAQQFQTAMQQPPAPQAPPTAVASGNTQPTPAATAPTDLDYNPYPTEMRQHVLQPQRAAPATQPRQQPPAPQRPQTTQPSPPAAAPIASDNQPSPDIMRLANSNNLSISTIAKEAHRLEDSDEIVIKLR